MFTESILFVLAFVVICFFIANRRPKNYPKMPLPTFPLLGHIPYFAFYKDTPVSILCKQWGDELGAKIIGIDLGSFKAVVINDVKLVKEAWNDPRIIGRPKMPATEMRTHGVVRGIIFQDGDEWAEQRRFTLRQLRDFGFGKMSMESLVMDEAVEFVQGLRKETGQPVSTQNRFNVAVLNALWSITSGERYSHDDPKLKEVVEAISKNIRQSSATSLFVMMPWMTKVVPNLSGWNVYKQDILYTYEFLKTTAQNILKTYSGDAPEHFTHVYIDEIRKTTDPKSSFYGKRGEETMIATLQDLFVAGAETTSTTLTWVCLYLAAFPEKQSKLHAEIDRVLGKSFPSLEHKSQMPYTEAVIFETLRFSSLIPLGLYHFTSEDVNIGHFFVPKNTIVIGNLQACHHDPKVWGDPEVFRPERFLNSQETEVIKHESFLPFSYGKRICIGETLAKNELFAFITCIFREFEVVPDRSGPKLTIDQQVSVIACPQPHKLIFNVRK